MKKASIKILSLAVLLCASLLFLSEFSEAQNGAYVGRTRKNTPAQTDVVSQSKDQTAQQKEKTQRPKDPDAPETPDKPENPEETMPPENDGDASTQTTEQEDAPVDPCATYMSSYEAYAVCQDRIQKIQRMQDARTRRMEARKSRRKTRDKEEDEEK